jgi:hypothetical protein
MSESFFRISKGLELDGASLFLTGSGVPGTGGDTDIAQRGSYYTDIDTGNFYVKIASGSGTDKWSQLATHTYVQNYITTGTSWREPVDVVDTTSSTTADIKTDLDTDDLIQGVTVTVGMRILATNVTGNKNVFIVGGVSGNWTLTEDSNTETAGDTVYVNGGTNAGKTYQYNGTDWVWINSADATEDGYIRTFIGKSGPGSETPSYSSTNIVANSDSLETAIGKLDAEDGYQNAFIGKTLIGNNLPSYSANNFINNNDSLLTAIDKLDTEFGSNVSNGTVILASNKVNANITALDSEVGSIISYLGKVVGDSTPNYTSTTYVTDETAVNVAISDLDASLTNISKKITVGGITSITTIDTVPSQLAEWDIRVVETADPTKVYAAKVFATHNGVNVDFTKFAILKLGPNISGLNVTVDLLGGTDLRLRVQSTTSVDVVARRVTTLS